MADRGASTDAERDQLSLFDVAPSHDATTGPAREVVADEPLRPDGPGLSAHQPPAEFRTIRDPERFFTVAGEEIAAAIGAMRHQILGSRRPGEAAEEFSRRSSQASATAEELVLADHHLLTASPESETDDPTTDDPVLAAYRRDLAAANDAIQLLYE